MFRLTFVVFVILVLGACSSAKDASKSNFIEEAISDGVEFSFVYDREDWSHWSDFDGDCINTRHELLISKSQEPALISSDRCWVDSGLWYDPYTDTLFTLPSDLDVDHVIPLKWAHEHGGSNWSLEFKKVFANDTDNLLLVDDAVNKEKGAKGPSQWLPPNIAFQCEYIYLWGHVLAKYPDLSMTNEESLIFIQQKSSCGL